MKNRGILRKALTVFIFLSLMCTQVIFINSGASAETVSYDLIGFATLNGGTTGGTGGKEVTVTGGTGGKEVTVTGLTQVNDLLNTRKKANDTSPLILKIAGKISGAGKIDIKEVSNITVIGVGTSGELEGIGINIYKSSNIIVRNMKIHHTLAPLDGIGIESSNHVWVDHCEIYNMIGDCNGDGKVDTKGDISGGDVDWYDGLLDVKSSSEYITVSWNYFHDAFKTSLIGSSDSDTYDRKITFHHNMYKNCNSRLPSYRGGTGHIFNNYYVDVGSSGINSRMGAKLRIEGNVFENVGSGSVDGTGYAEGPIGAYYSDTVGFWDVRDNQFINCKGNQPTTSTCSFSPSYSYSQYLSPASSVKSIVMQYAGIGKLGVIPSISPSSYTSPSPSPSGTNKYTVSGYAAPDFTFSPSVSATLKNGFTVEIQGVGSTTTDSNGYFSISNVTGNSNYTVKISKQGYLDRIINNAYVNGNIQIGSLSSPVVLGAGDMNRDGAVNMSDILQIASAFNSTSGSGNYRQEYDINRDNAVNMSDIIIVAAYFNKISSDYPQAKIITTSAAPSASPSPTATPKPSSATSPSPSQTGLPVSGDITLTSNGSMNLQQAINSIQPGKTIYLKAGTYSYSSTIVITEGNNGNSGSMKNISAYGSDKPIIDFSSMSENSANRGIVLAANYWHFKGITIQNAGDNGMLLAGNNNIIEGCTFKLNHDSGIQLSRYNSSYNTINKWPSNNLITDCISTENMDSDREDADGFAAKLTCGNGNVFRNCKALYNCDDGWDFYTKSDTGAIGAITLENCEAIGNGKFTSGGDTGGDGNGFKLGDDTASVPHILKNCIANNNRKHGFTGNGNPAAITLQGCSGSGNGGKLFDRLDNAVFK